MTIESQILLFLQDNVRNAYVTPLMQGITFLGNAGWFWIALTLVLLCFKKTRRAGLCAGTALLLSLLVNNLTLKPLIDRVRPYEVIDGLTILVNAPHDASFPSGHAGASFAAACALFPKLKKPWGAVLLVLAFLIAFSRLYVGVHYPTDVLAGAIIGAFLGLLAVRIVDTAAARRKL